jgi:hypothetical protein
MKKNPFTRTLMAAFVILVLSVSCKKDPALSKKDMITGKWKPIANTISPGVDWDFDGDIDTDIYSILDACEKDNFSLFNANGTGEENEGATKCDATDPQTYSFSWSLKNNDAVLVVDGDEFTIEQLTETTMKVRTSYGGSTIITTLQKF